MSDLKRKWAKPLGQFVSSFTIRDCPRNTEYCTRILTNQDNRTSKDGKKRVASGLAMVISALALMIEGPTRSRGIKSINCVDTASLLNMRRVLVYRQNQNMRTAGKQYTYTGEKMSNPWHICRRVLETYVSNLPPKVLWVGRRAGLIACRARKEDIASWHDILLDCLDLGTDLEYSEARTWLGHARQDIPLLLSGENATAAAETDTLFMLACVDLGSVGSKRTGIIDLIVRDCTEVVETEFEI